VRRLARRALHFSHQRQRLVRHRPNWLIFEQARSQAMQRAHRRGMNVRLTRLIDDISASRLPNN
jgi:hypothetical protein